MADYTPGVDEDHIVKSTDKDVDLTILVQEFNTLKDRLQALPVAKTVPDQETLDHWNQTTATEAGAEKEHIDEMAILLYEEATNIKNAGLLPSKYDDEYTQLENYVNSL